MLIRGKNTFRTVLRLGPSTPLFARPASAFALKPTNKGNLLDRHPFSLSVLARLAPSPGGPTPFLGRLPPFPGQPSPFSTCSALRSPNTASNEKKGEEKEKEDKGAVEERKEEDKGGVKEKPDIEPPLTIAQRLTIYQEETKKLDASFKLLWKSFVRYALGLVEEKEEEDKGGVKEMSDIEPPLTTAQRLTIYQEQVKKLDANFKLLLKCFVGVVLGLPGAMYVVNTTMEARLNARFDMVGARIDNHSAHQESKLEKLETRVNASIRNGLERLRLEIRNDRLQDRWW